MRKLVLATCIIILHVSSAFAANEPTPQPMQLSDAQWVDRVYSQPVVMQQPQAVPAQQRAVATAGAPAPDLANGWDVMQFNFGM